MLKKTLCVCVVLCLVAGTVRAQGNDQQLVAAARKTLQTYEKAIITLAAVVKIEVKGAESSSEQKLQCAAAIIDASGLVVTSATSVSPQGKIRLNRGGASQTLELECQVQEVKYRLTDGTEVLARIVLRDDDLDLAFLAPLKPLDKATEAKIAFLSLADAAGPPEVLDSTIQIGRTNEDLNYIPTLNIGRVVAILTKPRTCYLGNTASPGMPVFNAQGKVLGIVCRCVKPEGSDGTDMTKMTNPMAALNQIILPAADVARLVPQAKEEAKKPTEDEKKPAEPETKAAEPEKKPAVPEKKPAEPEKKPGEGGKKSAEGEKGPAATKEPTPSKVN
jgi:S1-C subfamily serine protease